MFLKKRNAFTMIELIFVIVVIGILAGIAVPRLAATRDDATVTKAIATVGSVRSALATERQKRILRGDFDPIYKLSSANGVGVPIFDAFDGNTSNSVLEYGLRSCATASTKGCWRETTTGTSGSPVSVYTYNVPTSGSVAFTLSNNRFNCDATDTTTGADCKMLTN